MELKGSSHCLGVSGRYTLRIHSMELKVIVTEDGAVLLMKISPNPFNGIERQLPNQRYGGTAVPTRIHSMELKAGVIANVLIPDLM